MGSSISRLRVYGIALTRRYSKPVEVKDGVEMRELRAQVDGRPLRTLYVFDPRLTAIVLLGGEKTRDSDFYTQR